MAKKIKEVLAMAFDGATIAAVVSEMKSRMTGGRIYKIYQPEPDELPSPDADQTASVSTIAFVAMSGMPSWSVGHGAEIEPRSRGATIVAVRDA